MVKEKNVILITKEACSCFLCFYKSANFVILNSEIIDEYFASCLKWGRFVVIVVVVFFCKKTVTEETYY
jgi:hypothetical protein